ncbi:MAG: hypothetical protein K5679_00210 [Lachnospiraceae bacterium]|nr:hypothetical protein [Lachnospiraceae bacterium]
MANFKLIIGTIFFMIGISGNELWGYDLSNIIGNEEPIHITIDASGNDVSGSDVSANEFEIDDDFDSLSENSIWHRMKRLWNSFVNGIYRIVHMLRDGTKTTERFHRAMERFNDDLDTMVSRDKIGKINFNPFIGMIRWVTGDLVFYELYIVFSMGITLIWLQVAMLVIEFIRNWSSAVSKLVPKMMDSKVFRWLFWRHI